MITLDNEQVEFCETSYKDIINNKYRVISSQANTGFGKTICISAIIIKLLKEKPRLSKSIVVLQNNTIVMEQNYNQLISLMKQYSCEASVKFFHRNFGILKKAQVLFSTPLTFFNNFSTFKIKPTLIIIDEFHNAGSNTYKSIINKCNCKVFGVTATLYRTDNELNFIDKVSIAKHIEDRIKSKKLCDYKIIQLVNPEVYTKFKDNLITKVINQDTVITVEKDALVQDKYYNPTFIEKVYQTYKNQCTTGKTIAYCMSINHAKLLEAYFLEKGVSCGVLYQGIDKEELLQDFMELKYDILFNVFILKEGFNDPNVHNILFIKPITTKPFFIQACGRGLRLEKDKTHCNIIDFGLSFDIHKSLSLNLSECGYCEKCKCMKYDSKGYCLSCGSFVLSTYEFCKKCLNKVYKLDNTCKFCNAVIRVNKKEEKVNRLGLCKLFLNRDIQDTLETEQEWKSYEKFKEEIVENKLSVLFKDRKYISFYINNVKYVVTGKSTAFIMFVYNKTKVVEYYFLTPANNRFKIELHKRVSKNIDTFKEELLCNYITKFTKLRTDFKNRPSFYMYSKIKYYESKHGVKKMYSNSKNLHETLYLRALQKIQSLL